jgi:hypothetical protein
VRPKDIALQAEADGSRFHYFQKPFRKTQHRNGAPPLIVMINLINPLPLRLTTSYELTARPYRTHVAWTSAVSAKTVGNQGNQSQHERDMKSPIVADPKQ